MEPAQDSIKPLIEIGSCFAYEIEKGKIAGLTLTRITKEEETIYYAFILSGKLFDKLPSPAEFKEAGLLGSLVPGYTSTGTVTEMPSLARYSIKEENLKPYLTRLVLIDKISPSKKTQYSITGNIDKLELIETEQSFLLKNKQAKEEMKALNFPMPTYKALPWSTLITTNDPAEIEKPEVVWILSSKSAHSKAAQAMDKDWFWSAFDDLSPFGNDDGADAFAIFRDWRKQNKNVEPALFLDRLETGWAMSFAHKNITDEEQLKAVEKQNQYYRNVDRSIVAVALGQIVLEGKVSPTLKELGIKAIERTLTPFGMKDFMPESRDEYTSRLNKMLEVLNKF